jgi:hypothetical protein
MIRRFTLTALAISMMTLFTGCLDSPARDALVPENDGYWAGKFRDLTNYDSCGSSLQCSPVFDGRQADRNIKKKVYFNIYRQVPMLWSNKMVA